MMWLAGDHMHAHMCMSSNVGAAAFIFRLRIGSLFTEQDYCLRIRGLVGNVALAVYMLRRPIPRRCVLMAASHRSTGTVGLV